MPGPKDPKAEAALPNDDAFEGGSTFGVFEMELAAGSKARVRVPGEKAPVVEDEGRSGSARRVAGVGGGGNTLVVVSAPSDAVTFCRASRAAESGSSEEGVGMEPLSKAREDERETEGGGAVDPVSALTDEAGEDASEAGPDPEPCRAWRFGLVSGLPKTGVEVVGTDPKGEAALENEAKVFTIVRLLHTWVFYSKRSK